MGIKLPTEIVKAERKEPKLVIIYSLPKVGKTTAASQLPNSLLIDLENRTDEIDAIKFDIIKETQKKPNFNKLKDDKAVSLAYLKTLYELGEEIKKANKPYKYIIVDSVTKLEDFCEDDATETFKKQTKGMNFQGESVLELEWGLGYHYLRNSFKRWVGYIITLAPTVILMAHVKSSALESRVNNNSVEGKGGSLVETADLDLTGKVKRIACAASDAIGFMYRKTIDTKGNSITMLNFKNSGEILCGSPYKHLNGQLFEFGKPNENGEVNFNWELVFPSLKNNEGENK